MIETKKLILEQDGKRMTLEQNVQEEVSTTPKWDRMKEVTIEKASLFGNSFMDSLLPSAILSLLFFLVVFLICK